MGARAPVVVLPIALLVALLHVAAMSAAPLFAQSATGPAAPAGETVGGISCDAQEGQRIHIHQHLLILDRGTTLAIPPNVGQPAGKPCIYWLHTHTPDGIIHIEAPLNRSFTLGDFFTVWGQPLGKSVAASARANRGTALRVWVDGKPFTGDPRSIPLDSHTDIVIEAGPPFTPPPKFTSWDGL
ncbi:MAG: hypothetical protein M3R65_07580 [Gemmatimonadota bacterium]|nr:hypothetical protein [Gemmatimonadota bacterium]